MTSYPQVTIASVVYDSYSDLADAKIVLAADFGAGAWVGLSDEDEGKTLVTATRIIDRQQWPNPPADPTQGHAIPFVSQNLDEDTQLALAKAAAIELASQLANGFDAQVGTANYLRRQKAGSVEQEFFYSDPTLASQFPKSVMDLLAPLFSDGGAAGNGGFALSIANGTCGESSFEQDYSQDVWR